MNESNNGKIEILAGDKGLVVLYVAAGTGLAIRLIASICWSAALIRKKNAEADSFKAYARTLEI